jgi:pimeloyl-[acyl-carrier protein] methyl ester esterase
MSSRINLISGWASDQEVWQPLTNTMNIENIDYINCQDLFEDGDFNFDSLLEKEHLVGWSMGAMIALKAALTPGNSIQKLTLISGSPNFCNHDFGWAPRILDLMIRHMDKCPHDSIREFNLNVSRLLDNQEDYLMQFDYDALIEKNWSVESLIKGLQFLKQFNCLNQIEELKANVLWIHGQKDTICPINGLRGLPETMHKVILPDSGHLPFWQEPELIASKILEF